MEKYCIICNKKIVDKPSHILKRKTCSRKCLAIYYKQKLLGKNNPHWQGGKIKCFCNFCGKDYFVIPANYNKTKYCSIVCHNKANALKLRKLKKYLPYLIMPKRKKIWRCIICGVPIKRKTKYCKRCIKIKLKTKYKCLNCGKTFLHYKNTKRTFCNIICQHQYYKEKGNPNYIDGRTPINKKIRISDKYKNWKNKIFKRDNYYCVLCGQKGKELHAHHKKPFHKIIEEYNIKSLERALNCAELWDLENGITLCKKCHKKINTRR